MARSVRGKLESRSTRSRLVAGKHPHWTRLEPGLFCGFHKPLGGGAGTWWARVLIAGRYKVASLQLLADDHENADGERILSWAQAQAAARRWAAKQTGGNGYTVADTAKDYAEDLRARKGERASKEAYGRLQKRLLPVLGERRLSELTTAELQEWRNSLVADTADGDAVRQSRDTANRLLGTAKAAFNLAYATGKVSSDQAWRRVPLFRGVRAARQVILSEEELQRLVDACEPGLRELVALGALTGARAGELISARVQDFHAADGTLAVNGKTGRRTIHLPPAAVHLLRSLTAHAGKDDHLITDGNGAPWQRSRHAPAFDRAAERAGLDRATTFYALRHSYISRALVAGVPTQALGEHCGTSARMIEDHYAKFIRGQQAAYAAMAAPAVVVM